MLWREPLIHMKNVCFEFSGSCVAINIHFDHVNEAFIIYSVAQRDNAVYWWSLGLELESLLEHYEQAEHEILSLPLI